MTRTILLLLLLTSTAHAQMSIDGPVDIETEQKTPVEEGLEAMIDGRIRPGTFCFASVQTDTVVCRPMKDMK